MGRADSPLAAPSDAKARPVPPSRWWWWLVAAMVLQFAAWALWFIFAAHHPVQEVPLATPASPGH